LDISLKLLLVGVWSVFLLVGQNRLAKCPNCNKEVKSKDVFKCPSCCFEEYGFGEKRWV